VNRLTGPSDDTVAEKPDSGFTAIAGTTDRPIVLDADEPSRGQLDLMHALHPRRSVTHSVFKDCAF
jgi:hypothetical protein